MRDSPQRVRGRFSSGAPSPPRTDRSDVEQAALGESRVARDDGIAQSQRAFARAGASTRYARIVAEVRQNRDGQAARFVNAAQDPDADVEIGGALFDRLHLRLETPSCAVARRRARRRRSRDARVCSAIGIRSAVPSAHRFPFGSGCS